MKYRFHIRRNGETAIDDGPEGTEFADPDAARNEGVSAIREILGDAVRSGTDSCEGEVIVKDQSGETVLTIPFSMRVRLG